MQHHYLISCVYLKDGKAVKGFREDSSVVINEDPVKLAQMYCDSGVDAIYVFDLSDSDKDHEMHMGLLKSICLRSEIPVFAGGRILRLEDIKKYLYAGCIGVILNGAKPDIQNVLREACARFGQDKLAVTLDNVDILFKQKALVEETCRYLVVLNEKTISSFENVTDMPVVALLDTLNEEKIRELFLKGYVNAVSGGCLDDPETDIMLLKNDLEKDGIVVNRFMSKLSWSDLTPNEKGVK